MEFFAIIFNKDDTLFQEIFFRRFLYYDRKVFVFVFLSMILGVLEENFFFEENRQIIFLDDQTYTVVFHENEPSSRILLMRLSNTLLSLFLDFWLFKRKFLYYQFLKSCSLVDLDKGFFKSALFFEAFIECLAIHVQSYPMINSCYRSQTLNRVSYYYYDTTLTAIFIIIRTLFFFRSMLYRSVFSSVKAFKICFQSGTESSLLFSLKCEFHHSTQRIVMIFISLYILILGFLVRLCERSFEQLAPYDWDYVWNGFWIVIVDMTSVGYGDYVPVTNFGRVIIGFVAIGGGSITSLIYILFYKKISFDNEEQKAYDRIKAVESKLELKNKAKKCIGLSLKFNRSKVKRRRNVCSQDYLDDYENFLVDIQNNVKDFATLRKTITEFTYKRKIKEIIGFLNNKLSVDFDYVLESLSIVDFFDKKITILLKNVELFSECVSNFEDVYSQIIFNMQYLNQKVLDIFSVPGGNYLQQEFEGKESNFLLVDFINSAKNSLIKIRESITISEEEIFKMPKRKTIDFDDKMLSKLKKNRFITLKKLNKMTHTSFIKLNDHKFSKSFKNTEEKNDPRENLILSDGLKAKTIMEMSQINQNRTSKLEISRKSFAYRISIISESNFSESRNSTNSVASAKISTSKKLIVKRFEKKELTCLAEEVNQTIKSENISESDIESKSDIKNKDDNSKNQDSESKDAINEPGKKLNAFLSHNNFRTDDLEPFVTIKKSITITPEQNFLLINEETKLNENLK